LSAVHKSSAKTSVEPRGVQGLSPGWVERQKMTIAEWRLAASAHKAVRSRGVETQAEKHAALEPPSRDTLLL
jgi:hypothetical protein